MHLFERDALLTSLEESLAAACNGNGRLVAIAGEAGAGKSTLVRAFLREHHDDVVTRVGACDPLATPRPLGPLQDIAVEPSPLADAIDAGLSPANTFALLLDELRTSVQPTVLVVEDAHWADESTLDLLRYLARRVADTRALVLVTYREDEGGVDNPVRVMLGDVASTANVERLLVPPLTRMAVEEMAGDGNVDAESLYRITGGNPFYVSEVLAAGPHTIPDRVVDAVLARAARLPADARSVLEIASVISTRVGVDVLTKAARSSAPGIDSCLVSGMLVMDGDSVRFRHELARRAVESTLTPMRRREIHADVLRLLTEQGADAATLAHHAEAAGHAQAVVANGLRAADRATALGAHREAAAHLCAVLRHTGGSCADRAELLDRLAYEYYLTDRITDAIAARERALASWRGIGEVRRIGDSLRWLSRLYWFVARGDEAAAAGQAAVDVLQKEPAGHELAMAYSNLAQLAMLRTDGTEALHWGAKALDVARVLGDTEVVVHALNSVGTVHHAIGDLSGLDELQRSLSMALEHDMQEHVARAYTNLMTTLLLARNFDEASRFAGMGIAYSVSHDLDAFRWYMTAWQALLGLMRDDWEAATADAATVLRLHNVSPVTRLIALQVLGRIAARQGDSDSADLLDEAFVIASATGETQRLAPVVVAHAEAAWLRNEPLRDDVLAAAHDALRSQRTWEHAELAVWLTRLGHPVELDPLPHDLPFELTLAGEHAAAFDAWSARGCHYEAALAAIDGDDVARVRAGAHWLAEHGATAALPRASARLRELGSAGIRGPRASTAINPSGLTQREVEVLMLIAAGLPDRQIAQRLVVSPRTIHHHVSAVLRKLDVTSRHEASTQARRLGIGLRSA